MIMAFMVDWNRSEFWSLVRRVIRDFNEPTNQPYPTLLF
jgi:hypothetical protein